MKQGKTKKMKIKIEFAAWTCRAALEVEAENIKEAVEKSVKDGANLYGANFDGANFDGATLRCATLRCATLRCANLYGANLDGANLYGANFDGANLYGANLYGANLRCANLDGANLDGATLYGANLYGANLYGAKHNNKELWKTRPVLQLGCCGSIGRSTLVMFYADKSEPKIYCGCFRGTIEEFEAKIHNTHGGTFHEYEYMAMVEHIRAIRKYQLEEK